MIAHLALLVLSALLAPAPRSAAPPRDDVYQKDVAFALDELEKRCGHFFRRKDIDWNVVEREFTKEAKSVEDDEQLFVLLVRLLARLRDGHAEVRPGRAGGELPVPEEWRKPKVGPGFFLCRSGGKLYVKSVWSTADEVGIEPGMQLVEADGVPAAKWFEERLAEYREHASLSTEQHAVFATCMWGFMGEPGERLKLELAGPEKRKKKKATITYHKASAFNEGPAVLLPGLEWVGDSVRYTRTEKGYGYVHVRRIREKLLEEIDTALAALAGVPGMILDFRGNTGGGCDHDALEARFVPAGATLPRLARAPLASAGPAPYGGPLVVIVDGTVVSAGETTAGMFMEDGRAYMIGESATAGMSSQKETIDLPSGKFALYVSVGTNRSSFNGGEGIEGIGVVPQELVELDPEDLAAGVDTLIRRAEELLGDFPQEELKYDPAEYGFGR